MTSKRQPGTQFLPPFEEFQARFRLAFGRELTREERRFYRLIQIMMDEQRIHATAATRMCGTKPPSPVSE